MSISDMWWPRENILSLYNTGSWGDRDVAVMIILRWIFRKWDIGVWTGLSWIRIGIGGGHL
jgi:hypothetical protein